MVEFVPPPAWNNSEFLRSSRLEEAGTDFTTVNILWLIIAMSKKHKTVLNTLNVIFFVKPNDGGQNFGILN